MADNGAQNAWNILSPIWGSFQHVLLRSTIKDNMSWVNYRAGFLGEVVDRFRWEGGCIVEHVSWPMRIVTTKTVSNMQQQWDQGEVYPSN